MSNKSIAIGNDHKGYEYKILIKSYLLSKNYVIEDIGSFDMINSVDYPDYANLVSEKIQSGNSEFGILVCDTGIGMSIAANRYSDVRAALCFNTLMSELSRQHNNANVLVIGSSFISQKEVIPIVEKFLNSKFDGGRHLKRIEKIK